MAAISTKSSVLAVKTEVTEGTLVAPTASSDYVALQPDVAMAPATETLANDEIRSSIGSAKPILGLENPTFAQSHYLRHSGVEGQAPNYGLFLKGLFGGVRTQSTEYDTVASSTVSLLKVNTGEGVNFARGDAQLIKDGTNGYRIRAIHSVSGDDLTLGFNVPTAPAAAVNLGKHVTYYPTNSAHVSMSVWHYLGNGGNVQAMAGSKVVSGEISAEAGSLVNCSFGLEGTGYYFNPVYVGTANKLDWNDGTDRSITVTSKWYKSPEELAATIQTLMNDSVSADEYTVTYSKSTGKFTLTSDGTTFNLEWNTGANTANTIGTVLGFSVAADDSGSTTYTSDNAITLSAPQTPAYDNADPLAAKNHEVMIGEATDYLCFGASAVSVSIGNTKSNTLSICSESGVSGSVINGRTVTVSVSALLDQFDSSIYYKYQQGSEVRFQYSFGSKSGGNWVAGKAGCIYIPTATVTNYEVVDVDGQVGLNIELTAFVDSAGNGEVYVSFV
jgi:hypothetical protein